MATEEKQAEKEPKEKATDEAQAELIGGLRKEGDARLAAARKAIDTEEGVWRGAGGYRYSMDGDRIRIVNPNGDISYAMPESKAGKAIMDEKTGPQERKVTAADMGDFGPLGRPGGPRNLNTSEQDMAPGESPRPPRASEKFASTSGTTSDALRSGEGTPARIAGLPGTTSDALRSGEGTPARIAGLPGTTTEDVGDVARVRFQEPPRPTVESVAKRLTAPPPEAPAEVSSMPEAGPEPTAGTGQGAPGVGTAGGSPPPTSAPKAPPELVSRLRALAEQFGLPTTGWPGGDDTAFTAPSTMGPTV